jgi:hypothetical protein
MDTFPIPQIPQYLKTILNPEDDAAWDTCWSTALKAALERGESFEVIRFLAMYFVGPEAEGLAGTFSWITILEEAGWTREKLAELMLARFKATDPNISEFESHQRREFLRHPPAWRVATNDDLAKFVEAEAREHPTEVLEQNAALAERLGAREADRLAVQACGFVRYPSEDAVATIMRFGREVVVDVVFEMVVNRTRNGGVPLRRVHELRLLAYAALETYFRRDSDQASYVWLGIKIALSRDERKPDPDQPFRVFRWLLKFAEEAPFEVDGWMRGRPFNPDEIKQRRDEYFAKRLREIMVELHYGFTTVAQTEHQGQRQLAAIIRDRGGELKFIESHRPGPHNDAIQDGIEVIVTLRPEGKPAFAYRGGRGFFTNLHPVAKPTSAMEAAVATRYGVV